MICSSSPGSPLRWSERSVKLSAIPWVAILDKSITTTPSEQFYVVLLFSRSAKKIYLTLALGSQQFEKLHGRNSKTLETIKLTTNKHV